MHCLRCVGFSKLLTRRQLRNHLIMKHRADVVRRYYDGRVTDLVVDLNEHQLLAQRKRVILKTLSPWQRATVYRQLAENPTADLGRFETDENRILLIPSDLPDLAPISPLASERMDLAQLTIVRQIKVYIMMKKILKKTL